MSLYTDLIAAGVSISHWQSDLYAPVNDTVKEILKRHPGQAKTVFKNQIDGSLWYEFPFQYNPFWEARVGPLPEAAP